MRLRMNGLKRRELAAVIVLVVAAVMAGAQSTVVQTDKKLPYAKDPASVSTASARVLSGNYSPVDIEILAEARDVGALPNLKAEFAKDIDLDTKDKLASAIVRIGETDNRYWDFLVSQASSVLQRNIPNPVAFDANGVALPDPPADLSRWASAHNIGISSALQEAMFSDPGMIANLSIAKDQRSIPILRQALKAQDDCVVAAAALGLAELEDKDSIPLIIDTCKSAPRQAAEMIAESLVYFDTPEAQHAVDTYIRQETAEAFRLARQRGAQPVR